MHGVLKEVFVLLHGVAKFAGRVIVSDARINDGTLLFLNNRSLESAVMLANVYQKFQNAFAVRVRGDPRSRRSW